MLKLVSFIIWVLVVFTVISPLYFTHVLPPVIPKTFGVCPWMCLVFFIHYTIRASSVSSVLAIAERLFLCRQFTAWIIFGACSTKARPDRVLFIYLFICTWVLQKYAKRWHKIKYSYWIVLIWYEFRQFQSRLAYVIKKKTSHEDSL